MDAIEHLQHAETLIDTGSITKALAFVCGLPEREYDLFLKWSVHEALGYRYYLARFVLESIEPESVYTAKDGRSQDLAIYKAQLTLIRTIPADVMSTPFVAMKPKVARNKSKTLAMFS